MTTVVITQPMLFPWSGFFEQLALADVYIYLDDVQYSKGSFTNRVQIRFGHDTKWLTVPLEKKGSFQKICDLRPSATDWRAQHLAQLGHAYATTPHREQILGLADRSYRQIGLTDMLIAGIESAADFMNIGQHRRVLRSTEMNVDGRSSQRVLDLVRAVGGKRYVTGHGAANYLDHHAFEAGGVEVEYIDYGLAEWPRDGSEFSPYVSCLDLIAWTGADAKTYLRPRTIPWRSFVASRRPAKDGT